jgi:PBSX family phage portal protein
MDKEQSMQFSNSSANSTSINKKVLKRVGARVIEINKGVADSSKRDGQTTTLTGDPFEKLMSKGEIIEPPFDMIVLATLPEQNTEMGQCIEAMEINIESFGHRFVPRIKAENEKDINENDKKLMNKEKVKLENFFANCTKESFVKFRRKLRKDLETTGCGYFEVIRNSSGDIQSFTHIPSYQMRLGKMEDNLVLVKRKILELQEDHSVKITEVEEWKRFRKFVQAVSFRKGSINTTSTYKMRWFKEFGDPRVYDNETGEMIKDEKGKLLNGKSEIGVGKEAKEVIYLNIYSTRSPYGLPRYIGNLLTVFGDRAAEEINFITFKNNNIPSMVVAVSNGMLTEASVTRIEEFVSSQIQGSDNYSKFLIIEAEGEEEGDEGSKVKIDIKPLVSEQHTDALFQNYSKENRDKIRRVWRLPPIFLGGSDDYTRSTAETSRRLADEQIFAPERDEFDEFWNKFLFPEMEIIYYKFKSNSPNTTDNSELVKILMGSEKTGGMTPRIARVMLEDILGIELPKFIKGFNPDLPFSLTMAEAVKKQSDPTEPNQLRSLSTEEAKQKEEQKKEQEEEEESDKSATDEEVSKAIIGLSRIVEKRWLDAVTEED